MFYFLRVFNFLIFLLISSFFDFIPNLLNCWRYSDNLWSVAEKKGWWSPSAGTPLNFLKTYSPQRYHPRYYYPVPHHTHTRTHTLTPTHTHTHEHIHKHTREHTHTHKHMNTHTHKHMNTHTNTYINSYEHTHIHVQILTYTCSKSNTPIPLVKLELHYYIITFLILISLIVPNLLYACVPYYTLPQYHTILAMWIYVRGVYSLLLILTAVCLLRAIPLGMTIRLVWKFLKINYWV